jgi:hypothetical protein
VALRFRLVWDIPSTLRAGEAAAFSLSVSGWDSRFPLPGPEFFIPPVPPGFILESPQTAPEERAAGMVLKLRVIPLDAETLTLPGRLIPFENALFDVPSLRIPVNPVFPPPAQSSIADNSKTAAENADNAESETAARKAPAPFPELESVIRHHLFLFRFFRGNFENIYNTAKNLWDRGYCPEALAELRRNERDHPAGLLFALLRKEAEKNLGLASTRDEEQRSIHLVFFILCLVLALAAGLVCFQFLPARTGKKIGAASIILCITAGLWCLCRFAGNGGKLPGHSRSGVVKETGMYHIPDLSARAAARLHEGQPVRLPSVTGKTGSWVWLTTYSEDRMTGWVLKEKIVFY